MYTGNCSPVELRGQSAEVRFLLLPCGFHGLKEGQACEPSWQPFSLIFNLTNPPPHSMLSQKEYIASLSQTLFPFSVHNWRSRNHPLKLHFRSCYVLPSLFPSSRLSVPLWPHCSSAVSLLDRPQSVVRPSSGLLLSTKQPHSNFSCLPALQWVLLRSPLPQRQVSRTRTTEGVPSCHPLMSGACWLLQTVDLPRAVFLKFCFIFKLKKCLFLNCDTF